MTGSIAGDDTIGLLCGVNDEGLLTFCSTKGKVTGEDRVGGLCGSNEEYEISNCYSTAAVHGQDMPLSVGGLLGHNDSGVIAKCYAAGTITSTGGSRALGGFCGSNAYGIVSHCYSTGSVIDGGGSTDVGAFCGSSFSGAIANSYFLSTAGLDNGPGAPLSVIEIKQQASFLSWDFSESDGDAADWMMLREGEDYPRLAWQEIFSGDIAGLYGVDLVDFAELARNWLEAWPGDCEQADIDASGVVDLGDLAAFTDDWLKL